MSLISDALRKARRDAAARGDPGRVPEVVVVRPPTRSITERPGLVVVLAATALAVLGFGAGIVWWALGGGAPAPPENPGPAAAVTTTVNRDSVGPESTRPPGRVGGVSHRRPLEAEPVPTGGPSGSELTGVAREPVRPTVGIETAHGEMTPKPGNPATVTRSRNAVQAPRPTAAARHEFVGEGSLGKATFRLDYLAYRPDDPFVQINGIELHQGWEIAGYTVERIQTDRVILVGPAGKIVLRTH